MNVLRRVSEDKLQEIMQELAQVRVMKEKTLNELCNIQNESNSLVATRNRLQEALWPTNRCNKIHPKSPVNPADERKGGAEL